MPFFPPSLPGSAPSLSQNPRMGEVVLSMGRRKDAAALRDLSSLKQSETVKRNKRERDTGTCTAPFTRLQ